MNWERELARLCLLNQSSLLYAFMWNLPCKHLPHNYTITETRESTICSVLVPITIFHVTQYRFKYTISPEPFKIKMYSIALSSRPYWKLQLSQRIDLYYKKIRLIYIQVTIFWGRAMLVSYWAFRLVQILVDVLVQQFLQTRND